MAAARFTRRAALSLSPAWIACVAAAVLLLTAAAAADDNNGGGSSSSSNGNTNNNDPLLSRARAVFQTNYGDIEFAFLPDVAPATAAHIFKLVTLGAYNTNHIFRVDKGFVAQVADVAGGRTAPLNAPQRAEAARTVPLEVRADVRHTAGAVSMGRYDDPNSGTSSFSFLLGDAPHLDLQYTIFGRVTKGMDTLRKLEELETRREGIFVMPKERVTIISSYWYVDGSPFKLRGAGSGASSGGGASSSGSSGGSSGGGSDESAGSGGAAAAAADGKRARRSGDGDGSGSSGSSSSSGGGSKGNGGGGSSGGGGGAREQDELNRLRLQVAWQAEELHRVRAKCLPS